MSLSEPNECEIKVIQEGFLNPPVTKPLGPILTVLTLNEILNALAMELGGKTVLVDI